MSYAMPSQTPPASEASLVCEPCQMPPVEMAIAAAAEISMEPTLVPPQTEAKTDTGITAWQNNQKITALWSNSANRNVWAYVANIGWKKWRIILTLPQWRSTFWQLMPAPRAARSTIAMRPTAKFMRCTSGKF